MFNHSTALRFLSSALPVVVILLGCAEEFFKLKKYSSHFGEYFCH